MTSHHVCSKILKTLKEGTGNLSFIITQANTVLYTGPVTEDGTAANVKLDTRKLELTYLEDGRVEPINSEFTKKIFDYIYDHAKDIIHSDAAVALVFEDIMKDISSNNAFISPSIKKPNTLVIALITRRMPVVEYDSSTKKLLIPYPTLGEIEEIYFSDNKHNQLIQALEKKNLL